VTGAELQNERIGCKVWEKLVAISERNTENVVHLVIGTGASQDMQEWREMIRRQQRDLKRLNRGRY